MFKTDVIIIGAGAAGLMCAIESAKRGKQVTIIEHANKPGKKILMSGGGRCNFTNYEISAENYISHNPHFCKSALNQYTQWDFIQLVEQYNISYYEKAHGQLFCSHKSRDILNLLLNECQKYAVQIELNTKVLAIEKANHHFKLVTEKSQYHCQSLVVACGGLSIPTMGATGFGYEIAQQFGLDVYQTRAGLVPFTLADNDKTNFKTLAGVSLECEVSLTEISFKEGLLFTHKGLSGPSILQISSYWQAGQQLVIDLCPEVNLFDLLMNDKKISPEKQLKTMLTKYLPKNLIKIFIDNDLCETSMQHINQSTLENITKTLTAWKIKPNGTEGYKTAEVTLGGVNVDAISSKTMEAKQIPGLFFIGEVLDVTGWLGGYNFQWAWSSGWVAGQNT